MTAGRVPEPWTSKTASCLVGKPRGKLSQQRGASFSSGRAGVKVNAAAYVQRVGKAPEELVGVGFQVPDDLPAGNRGSAAVVLTFRVRSLHRGEPCPEGPGDGFKVGVLRRF